MFVSMETALKREVLKLYRFEVQAVFFFVFLKLFQLKWSQWLHRKLLHAASSSLAETFWVKQTFLKIMNSWHKLQNDKTMQK